jgi:hypothetical protein
MARNYLLHVTALVTFTTTQLAALAKSLTLTFQAL